MTLNITDLNERPLNGLTVIADPDIFVEERQDNAPYRFRLRPAIYEFVISADELHFAPGRLAVEASDSTLDISPLTMEDQQEQELRTLHSQLDINRDLYLDATDFPGEGWDAVSYLDQNKDDEIQWAELRPLLNEQQAGSTSRRGTVSAPRPPQPEPAGDQRIQELRGRLDRNEDGSVTQADFPEAGWQAVLEALGKEDAEGLTDEDIEQIFPHSTVPPRSAPKRVVVAVPESTQLDQLHSRLDFDRSGAIDPADFPGSGWEEASSLDTNQDKVLTREELKPLLQSTSESPPNSPSDLPADSSRGTLIIRKQTTDDIPQ